MDVFFILLGITIMMLTRYVRIVQVEDDDSEENIEETDDIRTIFCNLEIHQNQFYVWENETNKFLTQGETIDDIARFFVKNYPNTRIIFDKETDDQENTKQTN
jgi:hypothetical protein